MKKVMHMSSGGLTNFTRCRKLTHTGRKSPLSMTDDHRSVSCIECMTRLILNASRKEREEIVAQLVKDARKGRA